MPQLPFDERIERAGHLIVLAQRFYDVWWLYEGADTRPSILAAMNRFPEFFRFDSHAQFVALVTHLASLFESRSDTINFSALISEAEVDQLIPVTALAAAKGKLDQVSDLRPKLTILRNNSFAHRSASLSYDNSFIRAAITPFQLRNLIDAGFGIINTLLTERGLQECFRTRSTLEHAKGMLRALHEEHS